MIFVVALMFTSLPSFLQSKTIHQLFSNLGNLSHLPQARAISNALQDSSLIQSSKSTQMLPLFGQFVAYDFTLTLGPSDDEFGENFIVLKTSKSNETHI